MKKIEEVHLLPTELKLDFGNPRTISPKELEKLKKSIEKFGDFGVIVINENNQVLSGNQRITVMIDMGLHVPILCKRLIGYSLAEQKAINIRANKAAGRFDNVEINKWLEDIKIEIEDISVTGFELPTIKIDDEKPKKEDVGENIDKLVFNGSGNYDIPKMLKQNIDIKGILSFESCVYSNEKDKTVHFFMHDYKFSKIWNNPGKYKALFEKFNGIFSPAFSLPLDMPIALQLYNTYRNRWLGRFYQEKGINVIPSIVWSNENSYDFCFDGIELGQVVAVNSAGTAKNEYAKNIFLHGFNAMVERIKPSQIIVYGDEIKELQGNITYINDFTKKEKSKKKSK
jgi:hypothetical protein